MGFLNILSLNNDGTRSKPVWSRSQNYGNRWNLAEAEIRGNGNHLIAFEGTVNSFQGDIAIDDITIEEGSCLPFGSCDFEKFKFGTRFCTWLNAKGD